MKVQIPAKALRASAFCMADKDMRYYLKGTLLDVTGPTEAFIVSTDGHTLFACRAEMEYLEGQQNAAWSLIIPADVIKKLDKKAPWFILEALPDGRYMLDGKAFTPIDGKFPDYRRVIPSESSMSGEAGQFNPDLLGKAVKAIQTFYGLTSKNANNWGFKQNGPFSSGVVYGENAAAIAVVMPMNGDKQHQADIGHYHGFMTPCQSFQKAA